MKRMRDITEHQHGHKHHKSEENCGCGHDHGHHEHEHHESEDSCGCGYEHEPQEHKPHEIHGETQKEVYLLKNLGCANCAAKMEQKISQLPGVDNVSITFATKQLRITAKSVQRLLPEIRKICAGIEDGVEVIEKNASVRTMAGASPAKKGISQSTRALTEIIAGAVLFAIGVILDHAGAGTLVTLPVFIAAYVILGFQVIRTALKNLTKGQVFDENFLMSIATLGAFAIREYPEAVGVMLFYRVGAFFEEKAVARSRSQIMDAIDLRPETVSLVSGDETLVISAQEARTGDILFVRPGDRIPLDGIVVEGESQLDTSPITGEPVPVQVKAGDSILSGCMNIRGQLKIRVEKELSESMVTRILDSVENAAASKPVIDRFITRFARIYTPFVVALAVVTAVLPSLITGDWQHWIYTALTFLVMSCPCALVLSVPLAFFSGIGAGSKKGILFKGGVSLEALKGVRAVIMDKTGTITEGNFAVQEVISTGALAADELLALAAGCERASTHPIALSIVNAANAGNLSLSKPEELQEIAGHGIKARIGGRNVLCGNRKLMELYHIDTSSYRSSAFGTEVLIAIDGTFAGHLVISDTIKRDAAPSISRLKKLGLTTVMLTGDAPESARSVAQQTGIDEVHARLLPQDKVSRLEELRGKYGSVMFVGDGINDAPVLAGANVGAAMGSGADAAIEAADVVYMTSGMEAIPQSIEIARSTSRISWQNIIFALLIKAIVMIMGLLGFANMWMAVFADTGVAFLCILNSIRILYRRF